MSEMTLAFAFGSVGFWDGGALFVVGLWVLALWHWRFFIPIQFHTIGVSVKTPPGQEAVRAFSRMVLTLRCVIVGASGVKVGFCRIVRSQN